MCHMSALFMAQEQVNRLQSMVPSCRYSMRKRQQFDRHETACAKQPMCALLAMQSSCRQAVNDAATVFGTAHFDDYQQQGGSMAADASVGAFAGAWHVYALEWTLESLHWCGALPHALVTAALAIYMSVQQRAFVVH